MPSPCFELAVTLGSSRADDAIIDLTAKMTPGLLLLSIADLDPIIICPNHFTHFPLDFFLEASFQCLVTLYILTGDWNTTTIKKCEISVNGTIVEYDTFLFAICQHQKF